MSENTTTEIAVTEAVAPVAGLGVELANLTSGRVAGYCSIQGTDFGSRVAVVNAMTSASPVADNLDKLIMLKDVVIQEVQLVNERTGELQAVPRITLIDADGSAFSATSDVVFKDLKTFFSVLGTPNTWPAPLPVVVTKAKAKGAGYYFTLNIAPEPKGK